ncbi:hypothetical protein AB4Y32_05570 [Paraburkholderia phymatum]|uniref:Uncharacterized protein n=1 Tax=Paraburkholderia phymatum TaxID=148447 RepID=A0ACC6TVB4_9BURK
MEQNHDIKPARVSGMQQFRRRIFATCLRCAQNAGALTQAVGAAAASRDSLLYVSRLKPNPLLFRQPAVAKVYAMRQALSLNAWSNTCCQFCKKAVENEVQKRAYMGFIMHKTGDLIAATSAFIGSLDHTKRYVRAGVL